MNKPLKYTLEHFKFLISFKDKKGPDLEAYLPNNFIQAQAYLSILVEEEALRRGLPTYIL